MIKENIEKLTKEKILKEYQKLSESYMTLEDDAMKLVEQNGYLFKTASNYKDKIDYLNNYLNDRYKEYQNASENSKKNINYTHYRKLLLDELDLLRDIKSKVK